MGRFGSILGSTLKKRRHRPRSAGSLVFRFRLWGALLCFTVIDPSQRKDFVTRTSPEKRPTIRPPNAMVRWHVVHKHRGVGRQGGDCRRAEALTRALPAHGALQ